MASDNKKVVWAATKVKVISTSSTFFIFSKILEKSNHINKPKIIPQITIDKNDKNHSKIELDKLNVSQIESFSRIPSIIRNIAKEVQSLNKLSHSKIKANLLGAQTDLNKERTATGSVADIKAPNNKVTQSGIFNQNNGNK